VHKETEEKKGCDIFCYYLEKKKGERTKKEGQLQQKSKNLGSSDGNREREGGVGLQKVGSLTGGWVFSGSMEVIFIRIKV